MTGTTDQRIAVTLNGWKTEGLRVALQAYVDPGAGAAIVLYAEDEEFGEEQFGVATVNLHAYGSTPYPGCVWIKDYAEGEGMLDSLEAAGIVERTGRTTHSGWVEVPEARLIGDWATHYANVVALAHRDRAQQIIDSGEEQA